MAKCKFFKTKCACGDYSCRILFMNEKKLSPEQVEICREEDYKTECLRYEAGVKHYAKLARERERMKNAMPLP